jgi:Ca2+-transporting ATPase
MKGSPFLARMDDTSMMPEGQSRKGLLSRLPGDAGDLVSSIVWHALPVDEVLEALGSDGEMGLADDEAATRLQTYGPNTLAESQGPGALRLFLEQFNNALVWLLLAAATISGVVLEEWVDTGVILAIVAINAVLGFVQESRAEKALSALEALSAPEAVVRRSGHDRVVEARTLVPGDLLVLEAGDRITADARVIDGIRLQTDEAALTGESLPVEKSSHPVAPEGATGDRTDMVFSGTIVTGGRGVAVVTGTGSETEFGKVAELLDTEEPPTPLTIELDRVGKQIALAAIVIAAAIFALGVARQIAAETMFLTAVALAVAAIPEGLSAVVTVTLSRGVSTMADQSAIVRRLPAVEALGATTVICSDKTGTLTRNRLRVKELHVSGWDVPVGELGTADVGRDRRVKMFAEIAALCNDARRAEAGEDGPGYLGDPTEVAVLMAVDPDVVDAARLRAEMPRLDELGFDSSRKRMSTLHRSGDGVIVHSKGAPEQINERCSHVETPAGPAPLTDAQRAEFVAAEARFAEKGLRTLSFAYRRLDDGSEGFEIERDLVLVALAGMSDEVRPEAREAVGVAHRAGVEVVMVTGDHQVTAETVARDLAIVDGEGRVMNGDMLRAASLDDLAQNVDRYRVFSRVDPADKVKIVHAWQAHGAIVAMTGDGVNDAPALRSADIGIAMGSGTAVAREASSMVLADDNFATIVAAVREGRAIFANLKKVVYFLLSANISEVLVMFFGFMLFASYGEPLLATQLLWINLVTDGLPAVALGFDPALPGLMDRPPERTHHILGRDRLMRLGRQGAVLATGTLAAFMYGQFVRDYEFEHARTVTFTALVVVQLMHAYNVRAEGSTLARVGFGSNRLLALGLAASLALHALVVYTPIGQELFETTALDAIDWLVVAALGGATFAVNGIVSGTLPSPLRR